MTTLPKFEEILSIGDADFQSRIVKAKDFIIAAAVYSAPVEIREKVMKNLSPRRRDAVKEAMAECKKLPARTKIVAQRVITKILFNITEEDDEERAIFGGEEKKSAPLTKKEYMNFIKKVHEQNPDFIGVDKRKRAIIYTEYLKQILRKKSG